MAITSSKSLFAPLTWLAASGGVLFGLLQMAPSLSLSMACAAGLSIGTVFLATGEEDSKNRMIVPLLGAVLFGFLAWIAVSLIPGTPAESGLAANAVLTARSLIVLSAVVLLMPILAFAEMMFSMVAVQAVAKLRGKTVLGGELQVISMIDQKFGGVMGSLNR